MSRSTTTIARALTDAAQQLAAASECPRLDAEVLLAWVLSSSRSRLFTNPEEKLPDRPVGEFADAVNRRKLGEPVAYITGSKEFWSLQLKVNQATLVPRPETETLVERALRLIPVGRPCRVLDLGTGSGAVAIAIARERPKAAVDAVDSSDAALNVAKENAHLHKLQNINFLHGDWAEPVADQAFDVVVSNPPYVRDNDPALAELQYEPRSALAAGADGLNAIRKIAAGAGRIIAENGILLLEHGADQQGDVARILQDNGWLEVQCFKDLTGQPRVSTARMSSPKLQDMP